MTRDQDANTNVATRTVFYGVQAEPMFAAETVSLPELAPGEILVKVITKLFDKTVWNVFFLLLVSRFV